MTVASDLRRVRDLLSDPARWTQGVLARTKTGKPTNPRNPHAVCFCLHGALEKVKAPSEASDCLREITKALYAELSLSSVNDTLGHAAVLRVLDLAIERAGNQGDKTCR